jgi:hypothetical protein
MNASVEELKEIVFELDGLIRVYRDTLNEAPRVLRLLQEAREVAQTKHDDGRKK